MMPSPSLPVRDAANDGIDGAFDVVVAENDVDLDLQQQVHLVEVPRHDNSIPLAPVAVNLVDIESDDADLNAARP